MRRIDVIWIGLGVFGVGGVLYVALTALGLDGLDAGVWSQALLIAGVLGWVSTYVIRVFTKKMTYGQQLRDYEEAVLQKRLEELSPEELEKLQAEVEAERSRLPS